MKLRFAWAMWEAGQEWKTDSVQLKQFQTRIVVFKRQYAGEGNLGCRFDISLKFRQWSTSDEFCRKTVRELAAKL